MVETKEETEQPQPTSSVVLAKVPTDFEIVYQTPDGVFNEREYLVWLGNMIVEIKQSLTG